MTNERVLITGGAGFIGRALVARCLTEGHRVTVLDNLSTGRLDHLAPFMDAIDFRQVDILDSHHLHDAMADVRPNIVWHLAAHHFIPFCDAHPIETMRLNVEGTHRVLHEAARRGVRIAVVASSGVLYPSQDGDLNEDIEPVPADVYGLSKLLSEQVARFFATTTSLACVAARLFNTFGPYETNPHLIPHIVASLHQGGPVRLGNIHTRRDYIHVDDVADLLHGIARSCREKFTLVNVGTGLEHSARDILDTMAELLGRPIDIDVDPDRVRRADKLHQRADTRRLHSLTGMRAKYSLAEGLRHLLAHESLLPASVS
ncbi:MAG: NAD-dependent epimerase/dehydratase family protein [Vicinamibacterales bacterium]